MANSPEYKKFKSLYAYLKDTLEPDTLAPLAFSCNLLTRNERDAATNKTHPEGDRMEELLKAVERRILADPKQYQTLVEAVEEEPTFNDVALKLRSEFLPPVCTPCLSICRHQVYGAPSGKKTR